MGTNDLVKDMRARHTPMRLPMITALGIGMLAARAHGLTILDGVYNDIQDTEGFRAVCQQGLEMGFDGKTLIHPEPGRALQRDLRALGVGAGDGRARSSPPSRRRRPRARAWSRSTAA